jgi:hypothetical protein
VAVGVAFRGLEFPAIELRRGARSELIVEVWFGSLMPDVRDGIDWLRIAPVVRD